MIRAVFDTSVLIRYLIKPGIAIKELIEHLWLGGEVQMVTAPELIEELEGVLARDYVQALIRPEEGQVLLEAIEAKAEMISPLGPLPSYTRDPKDDKFIACALAGGAEVVITVDKDILDVGSLTTVQMMTPHEFVVLLKGRVEG
ncbi:MAG: putative toxin-antitoxin system toxin component, PIN family [Anaerolineae bacterium]